MAVEQKRGVGENALQKTVRLLKKLNVELIEEGSAEYVDMVMEGQGGGRLVLTCSSSVVELFKSDSMEELVRFMEGSQLRRILMILAEI